MVSETDQSEALMTRDANSEISPSNGHFLLLRGGSYTLIYIVPILYTV